MRAYVGERGLGNKFESRLIRIRNMVLECMNSIDQICLNVSLGTHILGWDLSTIFDKNKVSWKSKESTNGNTKTIGKPITDQDSLWWDDMININDWLTKVSELGYLFNINTLHEVVGFITQNNFLMSQNS